MSVCVKTLDNVNSTLSVNLNVSRALNLYGLGTTAFQKLFEGITFWKIHLFAILPNVT